MKYSLTVVALLVVLCPSALAQQFDSVPPPYEVQNNMPLFFEELKAQLTYPLAWGNSSITDFDEWKREARRVLMECMENIQPRADDWAMEVVATEQREGYTAQKIRFNINRWCRIPAYLLTPDGEGPFPAIVALHDHGAHFSIGKEKMIRPFGVPQEVLDDADHWAVQCYDSVYTGDLLAAHGYVVLAIDALFWGERGRMEGVNYDGQQALAANFLQMGSSWGGFINVDDMYSAEFLASLPQVDKERVGCVGFSMGAYRSWMLAAMTDVVKVSASYCWINTTEYLMSMSNNQNKGGSAYSMLVPGLRRFMDYPHVAALACPKPTLFYNGLRDKLFPVSGVEDCYHYLQGVWEGQGAADALECRLWDEKHFFRKDIQAEVVRFFDKWLK